MKFNELRKKFTNVTKRVIQERPLSTNQDTLLSYQNDLIDSYNNLISYTEHHYINSATKNEQIILEKRLIKPKQRLLKAFKRLNVQISFTHSGAFATVFLTGASNKDFADSEIVINLDEIQEKESNSDSDSDTETENKPELSFESGKTQTPTPKRLKFHIETKTNEQDSVSDDSSSTDSTKTVLSIEQNQQTFSKNNTKSIDNDKNKNLNTNSNSRETGQINNTIMAQTAAEAMKIASQTVSKFDGNPLQLKSFLISIDLTNTLTENQNKDIMIKFILSRLEGKALECIPENVTEVNTIKQALEKFIVHDSAKIVAGKMEALRADRTNLTDFTKRAEELAEALQRSLVVEGCTKDLALSMAVDKTIEMCRKSARSEIVKSVLASKSFTTPKEVVATFIVQSATESQEKQVLSFRTQNNNRGNYNNNNHGYYNNNNRNFQNNYRGNQNRNNYSNNNYRNNYPNGNYRNNYSNNNNRNNYNNNNGNNYQNRSNNNNNNRGNSRNNYNNNQNRNNQNRNSNNGNNNSNNNSNTNASNVRSYEQNDDSQSGLGFHNQPQMNQINLS